MSISRLWSPFFLSLLFSLPVQAEQVPRWELGMGAGGVSMPDYRGSDETRSYLLPFPYVAYRFEWLKADRNGVRATLFDSDRVELNMSLGATPPVRSKNNHAREGMPDIKPMIEFGPSMDFSLWRSEDKSKRLNLLLPVRAAIEARSNPRSAGWVFTPKLNFDISGIGMPAGSKEGWNLGLVAGPLFADKRQNAYFYTVDEQYARPDRPAYQARAGYAGTQFLASLSRRYGKAWVGAYARYDNLRGAVFEDSPLVKRSSYVTYGLAFTWTFAQSSEMVEVGGD
ncbi:MipA/OmpV family protein [Uliginosibacterium sp. 31-16]|uniref:MipA/OmpV family protein n=1 Tax=Uliginosibacterium sp. 31-16 TaxID=3068315 RepID=UPI00273EA7F2|nr:MipA/OmpV family protein [Uliginosibacterium sp. 31-16]MDP5239225.1 MipA/OmpV family protein [Uliginosibacterium sp. 31-16]